MTQFELGEIKPQIHGAAYVAPTAAVIGNVQVGAHASIWDHCTVRGDINEITIGAYTNIQDNSVLHVADAHGCHLADYVTVGHSATVHACTVKRGALIGIGARILDGVVVGEGAIIAAGAVVLPHTQIPPYTVWAGLPAKQIKRLPEGEISLGEQLAKKYAERYLPLHAVRKELTQC